MNLSQIISMGDNESTKPVTSLRMRFIPSPWNSTGPTALKAYPPIEMRFSMDEQTKNLELKDVLAITESAVSDVMLPERAVDLRFRQRTTARLSTLHNHQLSQIEEFLNASQLNVENGRLMTPPSLVLPIAKHLVSPKSMPDADTLDVEYLYAGLEYCNTFTTIFQGWKLLYTSIEGGKADGRRSELSLRPSRVLDHENLAEKGLDTAQLQELRSKQFIRSAYALVDAIESPTEPRTQDMVLTPWGKAAKAGERFGLWRRKVDFKVDNWVEDCEDIATTGEDGTVGTGGNSEAT